MGTPLKALMVEDNENDLRMMVRALTQGGFEVSYRQVEDPRALSQALHGEPWDAILLDYNLPNFTAPEALKMIKELGIDLPCIVVSGTVGEEAAIEVMRAGAHDFLPKDNLSRLIPVLQRELAGAVERRGLKDSLRDSEERFRNLSEAAREGILFHQNHRVLDANQALLRMFDYSLEEMLRMDPLDLLDPGSRPQWETRLDQAEGPAFEASAVRRDGTHLAVEVNTRSLPYRNRPAALAAFYDLTARKESESRILALLKRIQDDNRDLLRLDQLKNDFLATVSHELRTPLTSIMGFLKLIRGRNGSGLSASHLEYVETALKNSERLYSLVNDLLDLSKVEFKSSELSLIRAPLEPIAAGAVGSVKALFQEKKIGVTKTVDPEDLQVRTEPPKLERVLINLLSNAIKFTPPGGSINLVAGSHQDGDKPGVLIKVKDTGMGICPEDQVRIFEKFYQVDNTATRKVGGTGLGLAICKGLVEAHSGRIWAESRVGAGSTFNVFLPDQA